MSRNSGNIRYSERRPYDSGRNPRLDRERRAARKRRRRNRLVKGLIAWAVCILLVVLVAFATMRVVGNMSTSKQREPRELKSWTPGTLPGRLRILTRRWL